MSNKNQLTGEDYVTIELMKRDLLLVFMSHLGGSLKIPVTEIDAAGEFRMLMQMDPVRRDFTFTLERKDGKPVEAPHGSVFQGWLNLVDRGAEQASHVASLEQYNEKLEKETARYAMREAGVYGQRNRLAIAFALMALGMGWNAGRGLDSDETKDANWRHVVYIDLPGGKQVSWHIAPTEVPLLDMLPEYDGQWDGTFLGTTENWLQHLVAADPTDATVAAEHQKQDAALGQLIRDSFADKPVEGEHGIAGATRGTTIMRGEFVGLADATLAPHKPIEGEHAVAPVDTEMHQAVLVEREARPGELEQLANGAVLRECSASGRVYCDIGAHGPAGAQQCRYCGEAPSRTYTDEKLPTVPGVDRTNVTLTDGSPVTDDHRELRPSGQQKAYVVLSAEERAKGFVRPVRRTYNHGKCHTDTTMSVALAETYARDPGFYGGTFCTGCGTHFPVGEFNWREADGSLGPVVGS